MYYLYVKHKVKDFDAWYKVFSSDVHTEGQREAGLHLLYCLRDTADPNLVVMLFRVDDPQKARAFTETPEASKAGEDSGVIGEVEVRLLFGQQGVEI